MALAAERTLRVLVDRHMRHEPSLPFPRHFFLYGIHWSSSTLSVFAHFPYVTNSGKQVRFRQVLLAQHWLGIPRVRQNETYGYNCTRDHMESDLFVCRWRISVALFAIRSHMKLLASEISLEKGIELVPIQASPRIKPAEALVPSLFSLSTGCAKLSTLRAIWDSPPYQVPECWIVCFP